jgi:ActR/RegA family two-component response regulator
MSVTLAGTKRTIFNREYCIMYLRIKDKENVKNTEFSPLNGTVDVHLLHVEDDDVDALLVRKAIMKIASEKLDNFNFYIDYAPSLSQALRKADKKQYHAILLDLALTDVEGLDNLRALKEALPTAPIIVLTGMYNSNTAVEAVTGGADDYIMKIELGDPKFETALLRSLTKTLKIK